MELEMFAIMDSVQSKLLLASSLMLLGLPFI